MDGKTNEGGIAMARTEYDYDSNGLARIYEDAQWFLLDKNGNQVGERYSYIEEWGEGFYKAEQGIKKNILRPVNGDVIFPMIFDRAHWMEKGDAIYAEIGTQPYIITLDGSIYDPARGHLPKKVSIDYKDFFEKFANWTLPGLQFFYRDTDAPVIVDTTYHVGDVLRAGFFVDVTTKLQKPAHKTRFLIASAHAAMMCEIPELCQENPNVKNWNLCTLHFNSYFKVMDVYEKEGVKQVFLLHIPGAAAFFLGHDETAMNFVNEATGQETTLIEMARRSLDEKMKMEVHPRSLDKEFVERMHHPIGLDEEYYPVNPNEQEEPTDGPIANLSSMIHKLANDADLKDFINVEDNFPYRGVEGSVCEGCIYANGIQGKGEGCGRLFIKSFRERYLKGRCEYRKTDIAKPSFFEEMDMYHKKIEKEKVEKACDTYALNKLKKFVAERLDGDIKKLKDFDFYTLREDTEFGDERVSVVGLDSILMKSVLTLAFADTYPDFTYESMDKHKYKPDTINITNTIFGINFEDYYKALETYDAPAELRERVVRFGKKVHTIGNTMVLPSGLTLMRNTKPLGRGYCDVFLSEFYKMMIGAKKCNMKMFDALNLKKKEVATFRTEDNFNHIVHELMLEDFLDEEGKPKQVFQGLFSWEPGISRDTFIKAANEFLDFCDPFVDKRADRIIDKLEKVLLNNH